jgi:hypothetical protein
VCKILLNLRTSELSCIVLLIQGGGGERKKKTKIKATPVHAMMAYSAEEPWYTLNMELGSPQSRSGSFGLTQRCG